MDYIHFLIDFILHIDIHLAYLIANYGMWVYAILFLIIFMETGLVVTPFLPGDSMIFVAGALAARHDNDFNIFILFLAVSLAAILGDSANFEIGKKIGKKLFSNPNSRIFKQKYLEKTHDFYSIHGGKTLILARFVPIIRTFAPFVGGMGKMHYKYFISYNIIGGIGWSFLFSFLGYLVGNIAFVQQHLKLFLLSIIILSLIPVFSEFLWVKMKSWKRRHE